MNTNNSLFITILALLLFLNSMESVSSFQQCDSMAKYLENLYQRLVIRRIKDPGKRRNFTSSGTAWRNSSLRIYFNMSKVVKVRTKILRANIILHRGLKSFTQIPIYQASYGLILKDINSSKVLFNRTLASDGLGSLRKRYCLVPNVLNLVRRWRNYPESNQGLLLAVHDTGKYSATLQTFYPKRNIYVPALALYLKPPKIYNKVYKLIPSEAVEIIKTKT